MRRRRTGTSYIRPAISEEIAATVGSSFARSAAAEVEEVSSVATSGRLALSHWRHWASPCGCEHTVLTSPSSPARDRRWWLISSVDLAGDERVGVDQAVEGHVDGALGGVLHRDHPVLGAAALDLVEDLARCCAPGRKSAEEPKRASAA